MKNALLMEIVDVWELKSQLENGLSPGARETFRQCADLIRMMVSHDAPNEQRLARISAEYEQLRALLNSARAIADRKGVGTAWERFADSIGALGLNGITPRTYRVLPDDEPPKVDMRAVCEALGFDPTNHHNAAVCPYCKAPEPPTT